MSVLMRRPVWLREQDGVATGSGTEEPAAAGSTLTETETGSLDSLSDDSTDNDDAIFAAFDGLVPVEEPAASSAPAATPAVTSAAAQPTTSAAATSTVTPPVEAAPAVSSAAVTPEPASSAAPAIADPVEAYQSWRSNAEKALAEGWYNLSDEQVAEIETNPKEALPKFAARVYLDAVTAATNVLARNLPTIIDSHFARKTETDAAEARFFTQWPGLKEKTSDVIRFAKAYRHLNPNADEATFIRDVGAQVAVALGIPAEKARAQAAAVSPPVSPPAQPSMPAHRPPAAAARHVGGPAGPTSPFEALLGDD